jgi:hypothetical protein
VVRADAARPDLVPLGHGEQRGFQATYAARSGPREVCIYGINVGLPNANPQLGCATVDVPAVTALDDLADLIAELRWAQLVEQVHLTEQITKVRAAQRAPWRVIGPVAVDALPAIAGD